MPNNPTPEAPLGPRVTDEELAAWRVLCNAATPGPWTRTKPERDKDGFSMGVGIAGTLGKQMVYASPPGGQFPSADANFIAAARTALPCLIDELEAERAKVRELEAERSAVASDYGRVFTEGK